MKQHWRQNYLFDTDGGDESQNEFRTFKQIRIGDLADFRERPSEGYSCPRCYGTRIKVEYPYIKCSRCGYQEELFDFPISSYRSANAGIDSLWIRID